MNKMNKKGFTLVELLLVIAIIGILAAVLFVGLGAQRERARKTTFKENARGLVTTYTACTDGGGTMQLALGAASCAGGPAGLGNVPAMKDCDGEQTTNQVTIASAGNDVTGDTWNFQARCNTSTAGQQCIANCTSDGCIFCNTALTYDSGTWSNTCASSTNCE